MKVASDGNFVFLFWTPKDDNKILEVSVETKPVTKVSMMLFAQPKT